MLSGDDDKGWLSRLTDVGALSARGDWRPALWYYRNASSSTLAERQVPLRVSSPILLAFQGCADPCLLSPPSFSRVSKRSVNADDGSAGR